MPPCTTIVDEDCGALEGLALDRTSCPPPPPATVTATSGSKPQKVAFAPFADDTPTVRAFGAAEGAPGDVTSVPVPTAAALSAAAAAAAARAACVCALTASCLPGSGGGAAKWTKGPPATTRAHPPITYVAICSGMQG